MTQIEPLKFVLSVLFARRRTIELPDWLQP
jgi:hypothetical protein